MGQGLSPSGSPGATAGWFCTFRQEEMGTSSESGPPALVKTLCGESCFSRLEVISIILGQGAKGRKGTYGKTAECKALPRMNMGDGWEGAGQCSRVHHQKSD